MEEFAEIEPGQLKIEFLPQGNGSITVMLEPQSYSVPGTPFFVQSIPVAVTAHGFILEMPSHPNGGQSSDRPTDNLA
jgi:hypothetical protein